MKNTERKTLWPKMMMMMYLQKNNVPFGQTTTTLTHTVRTNVIDVDRHGQQQLSRPKTNSEHF